MLFVLSLFYIPQGPIRDSQRTIFHTIMISAVPNSTEFWSRRFFFRCKPSGAVQNIAKPRRKSSSSSSSSSLSKNKGFYILLRSLKYWKNTEMVPFKFNTTSSYVGIQILWILRVQHFVQSKKGRIVLLTRRSGMFLPLNRWPKMGENNIRLGWPPYKNPRIHYPFGSVSKPCTPGEHQNSW